MADDVGSIELPLSEIDRQASERRRPPLPPRILPLSLSVVLIALGALAFASLLAAGFVLILYLREGAEGIAEFYEEFRFDPRLKTLVSAIVVGQLYLGVAISTIVAAFVHARAGWLASVAWAPMEGSRRRIVLIVGVALTYGAGATLILTMTRGHRVLVTGHTDIALLVTLVTNLVLLAPIAEELLFRGWLYTGLRARLSFWPSFLPTVALFAAIHWGAGQKRTLLVLPLAAALGFLREVTGSIKPTIALHASYNLVIVVLTLVEI